MVLDVNITPVIYLDPSGEFAILDDIVEAVLCVAIVTLTVAAYLGFSGADGALNDLNNFTNGIIDSVGSIINQASARVTTVIMSIAIATETAYTKRFLSGYDVYALYDNSGQIFYVGITRNLKSRMGVHNATYKGKMAGYKIMAYDVSLAQARAIETSTILSVGRPPLVNRRLSISNIRYDSELMLNKAQSDILLLLEAAGFGN